MRRAIQIGKLLLVIAAILFMPWVTTEREAGANAPATFSKEALLDGVELFSLIDDQQVEFLHPDLAAKKNPYNLHVVPVEVLVKMYTFFTKQPPPDEVALEDLTSIYPGWKPIYIPIREYVLEDQILLSAGIIDIELAHTVRDAIRYAGFDPADKHQGEGYVIFSKGLIPDHYPTEKIVFDRHDNRITGYPVLTMESELNIPAFRWRIWNVVDGQRYLMADWPVVVGKVSTRTKVAHLPMDQIEHYPHWTDPETGKYVSPGRWNPLGIWKLRSTHTRRLWYYHGTNQERLLKRDYRALSHGCIRNINDNIRRLSWLLLSHNAGEEVAPGVATGRLDIFTERRNRKIPLIKPVMARNVYDTIEVELRNPVYESVVTLYPNVYYISLEDEYYRPTTVAHLKRDLAELGIPENKMDEKELMDAVWAMKNRRRPVFIEVHKFLIQEQTAAEEGSEGSGQGAGV